MLLQDLRLRLLIVHLPIGNIVLLVAVEVSCFLYLIHPILIIFLSGSWRLLDNRLLRWLRERLSFVDGSGLIRRGVIELFVKDQWFVVECCILCISGFLRSASWHYIIWCYYDTVRIEFVRELLIPSPLSCFWIPSHCLHFEASLLSSWLICSSSITTVNRRLLFLKNQLLFLEPINSFKEVSLIRCSVIHKRVTQRFEFC